ncbi:unnamed protein product [Acanthoscelides obtectus]|uniref:Uncharacterized protein n=1 Tax=Acanthoscelides obtectus TaxID=200917 RepID=A0A9P0JS85_ACAOB|nr:unnamed protein product [Acanthoscelides obtectus]CAK1672362.1 hypothetical protein AOBTE_LOCUS28821 [Acanthoscelides obtectus]
MDSSFVFGNSSACCRPSLRQWVKRDLLLAGILYHYINANISHMVFVLLYIQITNADAFGDISLKDHQEAIQ